MKSFFFFQCYYKKTKKQKTKKRFFFKEEYAGAEPQGRHKLNAARRLALVVCHVETTSVHAPGRVRRVRVCVCVCDLCVVGGVGTAPEPV